MVRLRLDLMIFKVFSNLRNFFSPSNVLHSIIELLRLEKTLKIIKSNRNVTILP